MHSSLATPQSRDVVEYSIREAFYDCEGGHDGEPCTRDHVPHSWSETPLESADDVEELRFILEGMLKALDRPVIVLEDGKIKPP